MRWHEHTSGRQRLSRRPKAARKRKQPLPLPQQVTGALWLPVLSRRSPAPRRLPSVLVLAPVPVPVPARIPPEAKQAARRLTKRRTVPR